MTGPDRPVGEDDLSALVDGRLAPERREPVDIYLAARPEAAARLRLDREARDSLRARLRFKAEEPVPTRLRVAAILAERRQSRRRIVGWAAAACLCLALGGTGGWLARDLVGGARPVAARAWAAMAQDALSAHRTFAIEIVHPVEVKAAEEAHLVQWLSKRLKRRLVVPDLESFGLDLVGGRLLPAGHDVAALLMYADRSGARLTVYVRCGESGETALKFMSEGDLSAFSWVDEGYGYVVSAAMDRERLQRVARAVSRDVDMQAAKDRKAL